MDFHSLPRRHLQALCKKNKIPANMTNVAMANALEALQTFEGTSRRTSARRTPTRAEPTNHPAKSPPRARRVAIRKQESPDRPREEAVSGEGTEEKASVEKAACLRTYFTRRQSSRKQPDSNIGSRVIFDAVDSSVEVSGDLRHRTVEVGDVGQRTGFLVPCGGEYSDMVMEETMPSDVMRTSSEQIKMDPDPYQSSPNLSGDQPSEAVHELNSQHCIPGAENPKLEDIESEQTEEPPPGGLREIEGGRQDDWRRELQEENREKGLQIDVSESQESPIRGLVEHTGEGTEATCQAEILVREFGEPPIEELRQCLEENLMVECRNLSQNIEDNEVLDEIEVTGYQMSRGQLSANLKSALPIVIQATRGQLSTASQLLGSQETQANLDDAEATTEIPASTNQISTESESIEIGVCPSEFIDISLQDPSMKSPDATVSPAKILSDVEDFISCSDVNNEFPMKKNEPQDDAMMRNQLPIESKNKETREEGGGEMEEQSTPEKPSMKKAYLSGLSLRKLRLMYKESIETKGSTLMNNVEQGYGGSKGQVKLEEHREKNDLNSLSLRKLKLIYKERVIKGNETKV